MKNLKTSLLFLGLGALLFAGCKDDSATPAGGQQDGVTFSASITGATRASNASWDNNDAIGIYMTEAGGDIADGALAENKQYVTSGYGYFQPASAAEAVNYPSNGASVDFIAYYPYTATITDYKYAVEVGDQTSQEAIDLLYSDNATEMNKSNAIVPLVFSHKLSKIVLNITDKSDGTLEDLTINMIGLNTSGTYDLAASTLSVDVASQGDIAMLVDIDGESAVAEAIVLPTGGAIDYVLSFTFDDGLTKTVEVEGADYEEGKKYIYEVSVSDKVEVIGKATIIDWNEVPSGDLDVDKGALPKNLPLVYDVEHTAISNPHPVLPEPDALPDVYGLPDPFEWSDGSGRVTRFDEWKDRRAEIIAEIGHYEIGHKPAPPQDLTATYEDGVLTVIVTDNGSTLTLSSRVNIPEGDGPFPIMIGANSTPSASIFPDCIRIPFNCGDVTRYSMSGRVRTDAFWQMYPELEDNGDYSAWSWGISRLIDGIYLVADQINARKDRIGIIGCSYAGKMALFGGALDERIALTLVQESGGGGINSWRVSDTIPGEIGEEVERINNTSYTWFMQALKDNFMDRSHKLPYDHHELIALIAPRACLIYGNYGWTWMADKSGYVSTMAAYEVWKSMGITDRIGWDFVGDHGHCSMAPSQLEATNLFVNKFLHGIEAHTAGVRSADDHADVDYHPWINEWEGHTLR